MSSSLKCSKRFWFVSAFFLAFLFSNNSFSHSIFQQSSFIPLAGIVKVKPDKNQNKSFSQLRLTKEDQEIITYIITSMAENSKLWLLMHRSELNEQGDKINGVHPLVFLTVIMKDEYLKKVCMPAIFDDYFKRNGFLDGITPNMTVETQKGRTQKYLKDFMKEIQMSLTHHDALLELINTKNWEGFVLYLIQH
ncbi:MAG: hypothetical protein COT84_03705 [Chlamydiae bacterium CG10_big_fil_rev_8_21_14_0_10_35_9]|nr:MAG: hypothetical protein COT84_03705 [Chlamydiae bacterium CG10_big_fil_rev_8_21_14_0_10_35_9]